MTPVWPKPASRRLRHGPLSLLALTAVVAACGGAQAPAAKLISYRLVGEPAKATVTIDDQPIGPLEMVARRGIALPAGAHRITVEAPGYLPWYPPVDASTGPAQIVVKLVPVPE